VEPPPRILVELLLSPGARRARLAILLELGVRRVPVP